MISACRNPSPTNECAGSKGRLGDMEKIKDAILNLDGECRLRLYGTYGHGVVGGPMCQNIEFTKY